MTNQVIAVKSDRRIIDRLVTRAKIVCQLQLAVEEGPWVATVRNISIEGIGLITNRPFKPGTVLTLSLPTSGDAKPRMVRVKHVRVQPGGQWWAIGGVFNRKLDKDELDRLKSRAPALIIQIERRTQVRHTTRLKTVCRLLRATEPGPWTATVRNVSAQGIGLISNRPFKLGTLLTMQLPSNNGKPVAPQVFRVTHARPQPGNQWWVLGGVFLTKLSGEELQALV